MYTVIQCYIVTNVKHVVTYLVDRPRESYKTGCAVMMCSWQMTSAYILLAAPVEPLNNTKHQLILC